MKIDEIRKADEALSAKPGGRYWREWHAQRRHLIHVLVNDLRLKSKACKQEHDVL